MRAELHPPAGRRRRSSPACRCSRPRPTPRSSSPWRRLLTLLAGLLAVGARAAGRASARGGARSCRWCRSRWPPAGRRSCSSRCAIPLNPMSVDARRARHRDLDRVQRAAVRALPRRARGGPRARRRRCERTYRSTGAAVLASGVTAIAGFAVLVVSDIRMLRDFGFVTVVDLTVVAARRAGRAARRCCVLAERERGCGVAALPRRLPRRAASRGASAPRPAVSARRGAPAR